ncbi:MAG: hypothetical protein E7544_04065 [Ruminococcaceae bacterium]|nr:hypothetical protein [Oscillospiraceae bacterium]
MRAKCAFFPAANTPKGFVSFFDEIYNPYRDCESYIIKGGPGTGKSSFMRRIAEAAEKKGFATERFFCSSDPSSLDALLIPDKRLSLCDGTAPHIIEPRFPGAVENIINLGDFWDKRKLRKSADEIRRLFFENSIYHRRSAAYLAAAGHINMQNRKIAADYINRDKIDSFASRFIYREITPKKKGEIGERSRRFLSAISPKGNIFLADTVKSLCPRAVGIDDREGVVSSLITERIGEGAVKNGYDVIYCHCPMNPEDSEHILVPEKGVALVRVNGASGETECDRIIHTGRFMNDGFYKNRSLLRFNSRVRDELIRESIACLRQAKVIHDKLENIYMDAMDFDLLNEFTESFIDDIFA